MLKHTVRFSELRLGQDSRSSEGMPPYTTAGNLLWSLDGQTVETSMFNGRMPRSVLREVLAFFKRKGVKRIVADRADGHVLPMARMVDGSTCEMLVDELAARFMPDGDTDFMPL